MVYLSNTKLVSIAIDYLSIEFAVNGVDWNSLPHCDDLWRQSHDVEACRRANNTVRAYTMISAVENGDLRKCQGLELQSSFSNGICV
jgi:hypothetical protein